MDATLTYMAFREWGAAYDHITQNYFLWRRANGKWALLPWDFDDEYYEPFVNWSIYQGEVGDPNVTERGPNYLYDAIYKAFRQEYKQRLFVLNHTLLNPTNISALGFGSLASAGGGTMRGYADQRFPIVNQKLGLGTYQSPRRPANVSPPNGAAALPPGVLQASPYTHTANPPSPHSSTTWFIRSANGSWTAPLFRKTSSSNLTALPIPFERLTFGETYFWRCSFTDSNGRPAIESAETSFVYGSAPTVVPLVSVDATTQWKFDQSGNPAPANWSQPGFDDSAWQSGPALLAQETCSCLPEPIRTPLSLGTKITLYFRTTFDFPGPTPDVTLRLRQIIDDGVVIYLNGTEISRSRMPAGTVTSTTLASPGVGDAIYEGPFTISAAPLLQGRNVFAAEVHQNAAGSSDVVIGLSLEASVPSFTAGNVVINEVLADTQSSSANGRATPDYVEILNATDVPQNVGGMSLSDDVSRPGRYVFPPDTIIPPREYLVVWCDDDFTVPGLHSGFGLDNDGQTVVLFMASPGGWQLGDHVTFGLQAPDHAIGRLAGSWQLTVPTPGSANVADVLASPTALKINEWMASATDGPDWFELYNSAALPVSLGGLYLSDSTANATNTRIPALSFLGPHAFRRFIADDDAAKSARHVGFKLRASGDSIFLKDSNRTQLDRVDFGAQTVNISQGRLPDGSGAVVAFPGSASPDAANYLQLPNVVISEVLTHSLPPLRDEIELHNTSDAPINVGGWWLSDNEDVLEEFLIPSPTIIPAMGYVVFDESQFNKPASPTGFALNGLRGDEVFLSAAYGKGELTGERTGIKFGAAERDVSHGRIPTSVGVDFGALATRTFGNPNAAPLIGPVVISEIQYHPPKLEGDNEDYEFIELQNVTAAPVDLFDAAFPTNCWRLRDAVAFVFPPGTLLAAGERVLVLGFDPMTNVTALAAFRTTYGLVPSVRLFGPYRGKLDNSGASVELVKPESPVSIPGPDFGYVPSVMVDRVRYSDAAPWPRDADGLGSSLQRRDLTGYGNEPTNWYAAGVSAGASNRANAAPTVTLTAPFPESVSPAGVPLRIDATATDADGSVRRVEFFTDGTSIGAAGAAPFTILWNNPAPGIHALTARATDDGLGTGDSAPVVVQITNERPRVVLFTPLDGSMFALPTNVLLQAAALDSDGGVQRVEFYDNTTLLGNVSTPPYALNWTNVTAGVHALTARAFDGFSAMTTSAPVMITAQANAYIAYVVAPGTIGAQDYGGGIGMDFDVLQRVLVTRLGIFDSGGDGLAGTLTVQIYNRNSRLLLASLSFSSASPGVLQPGTSSRFKPLANPLFLSSGNYSAVGYGHNATDRNGNSGVPQPKTWTTDTGGGLLNFVGVCRTGGGPGVFPTTPDTGPADRYASGTFEYQPFIAPIIVQPPLDTEAAEGQAAQLRVVAIGTMPLAFRWWRDGNTVPGGTNALLTIPNLQFAQTGTYTVVITNYAGSATSAPVTLTMLSDSDHDGMPDSWEAINGLTVGADDAESDSDGDGATNLQEYLAGTNPQDPASYLKLIIGDIPSPRLEFFAVSNKTYSILWNPWPTAPSWNKLVDFTAVPTNRTIRFADPVTSFESQRYYRLVTPQRP